MGWTNHVQSEENFFLDVEHAPVAPRGKQYFDRSAVLKLREARDLPRDQKTGLVAFNGAAVFQTAEISASSPTLPKAITTSMGPQGRFSFPAESCLEQPLSFSLAGIDGP